MKNFVKAGLLLALASTAASLPAQAQINAGEQKPEASLPFTMTQVATFNLPWRIAFLPDGRMLITEKVGPVWLVTPQGQKIPVANVPPVYYQGQNGMLGVFLSPHYATDHNVYLTYAEPGDYGGGLALARAQADSHRDHASLDGLQVFWRQMPKGKGGQEGAQIAFSPDGKYLFLTVGDRQRMTPAQDPNQPEGKILRLTLDGKPAPGNPMAGKNGRAHHPADRSAQRHRSRQDRAGGEHLYLSERESDAVRNLEPVAIARLMAWPSRRTAGCGKSSMARRAATN